MAIWNDWLIELRRTYIVQPVMEDARNTKAIDTCLGHSKSWIFYSAIGGGQADFDQSIANLSPRDRVMLYAFFNQKGHVDELSHAFERLLPQPHHLNGATVLDIGCGPFTAGLSLANVVGDSVVFRYYGIDTSVMMRNFGGELAAATLKAGGLNVRSAINFYEGLDDVDFGGLTAGWTIVILSYLLASDSLNIRDLVSQLLDACQRIGYGSIAILYTNTTREAAGAKYPELQEQLLAAGFVKKVDEKELLQEGSRSRPVHYAFFFRPGGAPIDIQAFKR